MEYKPNDISYLGCRADKINSAQPILDENIFRMLIYYIQERSSIHIKKDVLKLPAPWTEDPILQSVRFTNVRRELDTQSKHLIQRVCLANIPYEQKILNILLFRSLNKIESLDGIFPLEFGNLDQSKLSAWIKSLPLDFKPFKKVFMVSGMVGNFTRFVGSRDSSIQLCIDTCEKLYEQGFSQYMINLKNAQEIYNGFNSIPGIGSFMAYQLFVDLTYCPECTVSENEFVVAGSGCKSGLKLLFKDKDKMTFEECLFWLRDNWDVLIQKYNIQWNPDKTFSDIIKPDRYMNVMSLENCFCELQKFNRAYAGGFVIKKYKGGV